MGVCNAFMEEEEVEEEAHFTQSVRACVCECFHMRVCVCVTGL